MARSVIDKDGADIRGGFQGASCMFEDEVERNQKTKAAKLQKAGKKRQKERIKRLHEVSRIALYVTAPSCPQYLRESRPG